MNFKSNLQNENENVIKKIRKRKQKKWNKNKAGEKLLIFITK